MPLQFCKSKTKRRGKKAPVRGTNTPQAAFLRQIMDPVKIRLINLVEELDPPLGLAYVATYAREKIGRDKVDISIIDVNFINPIEALKKDRPDIIGISVMTAYFNKAKKLAEKIKELYADTLIVVGGVHLSTHKESFNKLFDIAVIGEGEETFCSIVKQYIDCNRRLDAGLLRGTNGIMFWDGDKAVETEPRELIEPLDQVPYPDRSLFDKRYFKKNLNRLVDEKSVRTTTMITSRGCPFKCVFCSTSLFWKKVRFFSAKKIADEVEYLHKDFGIEVIAVWDDLFGITKKRVRECIDELKNRDLLGKVVFITMFKADLVDDEMCVLLKELGVKGLNFGFESGSQKMLSYLKKDKLTVEQIKDAVLTCNRHDMKVFGSFMFGSPGETIDDMKKTIELIDFMKEQKVEGIWAFVTTPFPGTELWRYVKEKGLLDDDFDFDYTCLYNTATPICLDNSVSLKEFRKIFKIVTKKMLAFSKDTWKNRIKRAILDPKRFFKRVYNLIFLYSSVPVIIKNIRNRRRT